MNTKALLQPRTGVRRVASRLLWKCACLFALGTSSLVSAAQIDLTFVDSETRKPVPCRIHLKDSAGKPVRPAKELPFWHDHFVCNGFVRLELARGAYSYEIERGPEYRVTAGRLTVSEDTSRAVTNLLERLVDLSKEGWWSGELHVHRPLRDIELLMQAEDLHVAPVITWWNDNNAWKNRDLPVNLLVRFDDNRFFHQMGGEDERAGGALLFFNLRSPLEIAGAGREHPSPMKFLALAHGIPGSWVDIEKPFWYDTPVWLSSGMVNSVGIAHNHMHRDGVFPNEAWGRARDTKRLSDPQGNGFWTQEIYYHILNTGLRLPPSAGSASGVLPNPVGYDRMYVQLDGDLTYEKWWDSFRAGRVFVSNGPLLRCRANGKLPGHVFKAEKGEALDVTLDAAIDSRDPVASVEVIQNGKAILTLNAPSWRTNSLATITFNESGWFLVRAIASVPNTFRFASTGPFYVEIGSETNQVSRSSAQFFLDWVRERKGQIKLDDVRRREEVLAYHNQAEVFWQAKVDGANAE